MSNKSIGFIFIMIVGLIAFADTPQHPASKDIEVCTGTSGSITACSFGSPTYSIVISNLSATVTDSMTIEINDDVDTFILYGGESFATNDSDGYPITKVEVTALSGTPSYRIIGIELQ